MSKSLPLNRITAKNDQEADWILYGSVGGWGNLNASVFSVALAELEGRYKRINMRVHSPGGVVYEGLRIFNAIQNSKAEIHLYIEGISASMMSYIQTAIPKERVHIARNARVMLHQVRSGKFGSAEQLRNEATLVDSLNETLAEQYATYTDKKKDWVLANWMKEGQDTWFTSQEAKEAGLVGDIYDGPIRQSVAVAATSQTEEYETMCAAYAAQLDDFDNHNPKPKMKEVLVALGLGADGTEEQAVAAIQKLQEFKTGAVNALIAHGESKGTVYEENKTSMERFAEVDFAETLRLATHTEEPEAPKADAQNLEVLLELGKQKGLITDQNQDSYKKLAESNYEALATMIKAHKGAVKPESEQRLSDLVKKAGENTPPKAEASQKPEGFNIPDIEKEDVSVAQMVAYRRMKASESR